MDNGVLLTKVRGDPMNSKEHNATFFVVSGLNNFCTSYLGSQGDARESREGTLMTVRITNHSSPLRKR